jgi:hypothetical protein
MCNERERLIDYLYEEGDLRDRAEVQAHLVDCATCRDEIAALRAVRQDVMAWAVPTPQPIWRPLPAPRPPMTWRDVPAWALAAAAAVVLMAGASGAAVSRFFLPGPTPESGGPVVATSASPATSESAVGRSALGSTGTPAAATLDVVRMSRRIDEVEARLARTLASQRLAREVPVMTGTSADVIQDLQRRLAVAEAALESQALLNIQLDKQIRQARSTARSIARSDEGLLVRAAYGAGPAGSGR